MSSGPTWVVVRPENVPLPDHGWKLHISSRPASLEELVAKILPVLLRERCHFKVARSRETLMNLNEGLDSPASVGKAVTVYPDPARARSLGLELAGLLRGHDGPRVLSDRRVDENAPVYYRYGPFVSRWHADHNGQLGIRILGPDGSSFDGLATLSYRQPAWVADPFEAAETPSQAALLGDRFRVTRGIHQAARGNVYRAVDLSTGREVIVKQARAHVGEDREGADGRMRLRNERRVLDACAGLAGIPAVLDHFAHGDDEFLATTLVGERNLLVHVHQAGRLLLSGDPTAGSTAELTSLAAGLARIVVGLHERGVVMRDISPRNVVVGEDRVYLVDFGLASLDGVFLPGATPGFAPLRQLRSAPPRPADDCYALGMTLVFAAAGRLPVAGVSDPDLARRRTLQALAALYGDAFPAFSGVVDDLLSEDDEPAGAALRSLADGSWLRTRTRTAGRRVPLPAAATASLEERALELVLRQADTHLLAEADDAFASVDATIYTGSAGVGLELLHHLDHPDVPQLVKRLADHAVRASERVTRHPGLYLGSTGVELFLRLTGAHDTGAVNELSDDGMAELGDDVMAGVAGVGLARLLLYDHTGEQRQLDAAVACAGHLRARPSIETTVENDLPPSAGTDVAYGYAHGLAGVVDFLLGLAVRTGSNALHEDAYARAVRLCGRAAELGVAAGTRTAMPIAAGWCRGLAGISRTLLHAAAVFGEPSFRRAATGIIEVSAGWVPRLENLGQCCGAAGIGTALVDCAVATGDERYLDLARPIARQLLIRSRTPDDRPTFADPDYQDAPVSWGMGNAGILSFLRRLRQPAQGDVLPPLFPSLPPPYAGE